jgi:hypothetical protein
VQGDLASGKPESSVITNKSTEPATRVEQKSLGDIADTKELAEESLIVQGQALGWGLFAYFHQYCHGLLCRYASVLRLEVVSLFLKRFLKARKKFNEY